MKLAINQAYFFPYIGYFQLIESVDKFILYDRVSFRKKSWMTRNRILLKGSGEPYYIQIPTQGASSFQDIKSIEITKDWEPWKRKFLRIIYSNYAKAPFFNSSYSFLEQTLSSAETNRLHYFNSFCIKQLCQYLDVNTNIQCENDSYANLESELNHIYEDGDLMTLLDKKTKRIMSICKLEGANHYVNLPGGQELYTKDLFESNEIQLNFLQPKLSPYSQFKPEFVPHLSIIDVLMHLGKEETKKQLKNYKLI